MSDFFVIAEEEIVLAFRMAGADGRAVSGRDEALEAFRDATGKSVEAPIEGAGEDSAVPRSRGAAAQPRGRPRPKVLVLTEEVADMIGVEAREWQAGGAYPLIVEVPGQGPAREDRKGLVDLVREAIGVSI
jgi:vacuolar-type H+-ATPase subunit F/Vma7